MLFRRSCFPLIAIFLAASLSIVHTFVGFRDLMAPDGILHLTNIVENLQPRHQVDDIQQSLLVPAFTFLQLDEPLKLNLFIQEYKNETATVVLASAIRQDTKVAFVVVEAGIYIDGYDNHRQALPRLPSGLGCAFATSENETTTQQILLEPPPTSMIQVHAHTLRSYNSSSIWTCDLPTDSSVEWKYVTIVLPEWAERVAGNGVFRLGGQDLSQHNLSGKINACNKHIYNINNLTSQYLNEYMRHYRRLGVQHFTFYFEQGTDEDVFDVTKGIDMHSHADITILLIPANLRKLWNHSRNHVLLLERFTSSDCLWRSKAMDLNWTLIMFDLDEFLVGTRDLPTFLSTWSHPLLYVKHQLVKFPHTLPRIYPDKHLNISTSADGDMGKTIYKTNEVDVAWTHFPTCPDLHRKSAKELMLLHFRNATRIKYFRDRQRHEWMEYKVV